MRAKSHLSRRGLLQALSWGTAATLGGQAWAQPPGPFWGRGQGPAIEIDLPQLQYGGRWNPRPGAMRELATELRLRTRLELRRDPSIVKVEDDSIFRTPFLYIAGFEAMPDLGAHGQAQLRQFVDLGGMLIFDDAGGGSDRGFRDDVHSLVTHMLPGSHLEPVGSDHVIYRSFYLLDSPVGRTRASEQTLAVQEEGLLKVIFLPNDLGGALARDDSGRYRHRCSPGGSVQREWAIRFGINLLLYATCTDYKADRAHVETLLRSRRWK